MSTKDKLKRQKDLLFCEQFPETYKASKESFDADYGNEKEVRMTPSQIADKLKVNVSTIREWCKYFDIDPSRNEKNHRIFNLYELEKLAKIYWLIKVDKKTRIGAELALKEWDELAPKVYL